MTTPTSISMLGLIVGVYQPRFGSNRQFLYNIIDSLSEYSHRKGIIGGDLEASMSFNTTPLGIEEWFEEGLGRDIIVTDQTGSTVFTGFVDQVSVSIAGKLEIRGPLMDMGNRVRVVYSTVDTSIYPPIVGVRKRTSTVEDTLSQQRYGIITKVFSLGGATKKEAEQYRDIALKEYAFPRSSGAFSTTSNTPKVTLLVKGYYEFLNLNVYNSRTSSTVNLSSKLSAILTADPNSLFNSAIITENTLQISAYEDEDRTEAQLIKTLVGLGDSSQDRWEFQVDGVNCYYRPLPHQEPPAYVYSIADNTLYSAGGGKQVHPWRILPGRWIVTKDWMMGKIMKGSEYRIDPRYRLIEEIQYSAPWSWTINGSIGTQMDQALAKLQIRGF